MKHKKVSVIVPIYNNSKTIKACIQSIQEQDYNNFDIIIINDGSTDNSGQICDDLAQKDTKIKVIHQENQGVSAARNRGVNSSESEYICFVDADDEVDEEYISELVKSIENDCDLVISGFQIYHEKETIDNKIKNEILDLEKLPGAKWLELFDMWMMAPACGKIFKREILLSHQIYFDINISCGEDHLMVFQYLKYCKRIAFIDKSLYRYYAFRSNGSKRKFPLDAQIKIFRAKIDLIDNLEEYCARMALNNLKSRFKYLERTNTWKKTEWEDSYTYYWKYIVPFLNEEYVFGEEAQVWLEENRKNLLNGNLVKIRNESKRKNTKRKIKRIYRKMKEIKSIIME